MSKSSSRLGRVARRGLQRRPSAAMTVALMALFVALSGGAYAAVTIPSHSIGAAQLKTFAVTNPKLANNSVGSRKIMPGAVGFYRVNRNEVQLRVTGSCTGTNQAITSVSVTGSTTCGTTSPLEANSPAGVATPIPVGTAPVTPVASYSLAGGSAYLVQADPAIEISGTAATAGNAHVTVTCKLAAGTATTAVSTQSVTADVNASGNTVYTSLPLTVVAPTSTAAQTASLTCTQSSLPTTATPTVTATSTIYALGITQPSTTTTTTTAAAVRR
jgi:hypothetical protein